MSKFKETVKYEVVLGLPENDPIINGRITKNEDIAKDMWNTYAKEYYSKTDVYVSAIANEGHAIYNDEWGCPKYGERVITFNCTANRTFIKDLSKYEEGIVYITTKLKEYFKQSTVTITKINSEVLYLSDNNTN